MYKSKEKKKLNIVLKWALGFGPSFSDVKHYLTYDLFAVKYNYWQSMVR